MMCPQNVLFGYLPETVMVSGREYRVKTDFRTWLNAGEILKSHEAPERKAAKLVKLCYIDERPRNTGLALSGIMKFYKNAFPQYKTRGKGADFSADFDGQVIFSGFRKAYGIDLAHSEMHWYSFAPLLFELSDCAFSKIMEYRSTDISKLDKTSRNFFAKMKSLFALPSPSGDASFAQSLWEMF